MGDTATLFATGDVDLASEPEWKQALEDLLATGAAHLRVDLRGVEFIDAVGVQHLVRAGRTAASADASFALRNAGPLLRRVLAVLDLTYLLGD